MTQRGEAEDLYEEMFRRNAAPKLLIDPEDGAIVDANPAALSFYGYTQEQIRALRIQDINQLAEPQVKAEMEKARCEDRRYFEFRHRLANGEIRDVKVYSGPLVIGGKTYLHSIIHDFTEALVYRKSLERYKAIFDTLPVGIFRNRPGVDGPFEEINPAMARIFGAKSMTELLRYSTAQLYRDPALRQDFSKELLDQGEIHRREMDLQTIDGRAIRAAITVRVSQDEHGEPVFDGIVEDITEHYRAEQERTQILESLGEGVFGIDEKGRFTFLNTAGCRLLGFNNEAEALGRNAHTVSHHSHSDGTTYPESECPIKKVAQTGTSLEEWEDWFWHQNGKGFPVLVFATPLSGSESSRTRVVVAFYDISKRKAAEAARDQVLSVLDATPDIVTMTLPDGSITYINRSGLALLNESKHGTGLDAPVPEWAMEKGAIHRASKQVHPEWAQRRVMEEGVPAAMQKGAWEGETALVTEEGREIPVSQIILAHFGEDGEVTRFSTIMRDISKRRKLEKRLRRETAFSEAIMRELPGIFYLINETEHFVRWNRHAEEVTGRTGEAMATARPTELFPPEERELIRAAIELTFQEGNATAEAHVLEANGKHRPYFLTGTRVELDDETYLLGIGQDISERKAMEQELKRLATRDSLTGLYNRARLYELLELARAENERYDTPFSLVMFDIDHFKAVNDEFGHQTGDDVLRELTRRAEEALREPDILARWGGEEFMVLATHTDAEGATQLAERLRQSVAQTPFPQVGSITISLGVAAYRSGEPMAHLEKRVDEALYAAKENGRNRVEVEAPAAL